MHLTEMLFYLASPLFAFLFQMLLNRLFFPRIAAQVIALICLAFALVVSLTAGIKISQNTTLTHLSFALLLTLGMLHIYFHFFNMSETARRIRILNSIRTNNPYPEEKGILTRISRLVQLKLVEENGGDLFLTKNPLRYLAVWIEKMEYCLYPERNA